METNELLEVKEPFGSMTAMRMASDKDNPDFNELARYAVAALDEAFGDTGLTVGDCLGVYHDGEKLIKYAVELLASGELEYELVEHCVSEGIMYQSTMDGELEPYDFAYAVRCSGFDGGAAYRSGISPAMYIRTKVQVERDNETSKLGLCPRDMLSFAPPVKPHIRTSREGADIVFFIRVSLFAAVLSGKDYAALVQAARKFDAAPRVHCTALVFNDKGMRKLCRKRIELMLEGSKPCDLVPDERLICANTEEPDTVMSAVRSIDDAERRCLYESLPAKREAMWKDCRRDLESAGISSKTCPGGLYKVVSGECLDLFIAGSCQGFVSPHVCNTRNFFAERGDRYVVNADRGNDAYVFIKGHHVAVRRFSKDGRESVVPAEPLPTREYTVGFDERTVSGAEGREIQHKRGTVWVDLSRHNGINMAAQHGRTELKPGIYGVYGSDDMYSMIDAS